MDRLGDFERERDLDFDFELEFFERDFDRLRDREELFLDFEDDEDELLLLLRRFFLLGGELDFDFDCLKNR